MKRFLFSLYLFLLYFDCFFGIIAVIDSKSWLFCFFANNFCLLLYLLEKELWFLFLSAWIFYFHFFFFIFLFVILFLMFLLLYFIIFLGDNYFHLFYLYLFHLFFERLIIQILLFFTIILYFFFFSSCFQWLLNSQLKILILIWIWLSFKNLILFISFFICGLYFLDFFILIKALSSLILIPSIINN